MTRTGPPPGIVDRTMLAERLGVNPESITTYVKRGQAPEPDGVIGNSPWWYEQTIAEWIAKRPGRGWWRSNTVLSLVKETDE